VSSLYRVRDPLYSLYSARHPLPSTTVRHDGRFRFSAGSRRQGQRGRREAQHEEDLRAQGREGFLRPRPGCGCPRGTTHSRRGSQRGCARRPSPRASVRARVSRRTRARSVSARSRPVQSPNLRAATANLPETRRENLPRVSAMPDLAWDRTTSLSVSRGARSPRAARGAR
jgi:hypothetical protein